MVKITKANGDVWELSVDEAKAMENNTKVSVPKVEQVESLLIVPKRQYKQRRAKWDRWTKEEDNVLKSNHSTKVMRKLLKHRTEQAISTRIKVLRHEGSIIKLFRGRGKAKSAIKSTDKRIPMMKAVNQIVKELKIKYPYTETNELRRLAFKVYKDSKPKVE